MTGDSFFPLAFYRRGIYQAKQPDIQLQPFTLLDSQEKVDITKAREGRQKWRTSLYMFMGLACSVFILNTSFLAWIVRTRGTNDGIGVVYEASCDTTKKVNVGIHLLINILSSALFSASNYCMQCLSAPTRPELDEAHRKGHWLDIGIPSLHNIVSSSFARRKKVCWLILAFSSFPLHLCYNSVVFMSRSAQTYGVIQFGPEAKAAIENGSFNGSQFITSTDNELIGLWYNPYVNGQLYADAFKEGRLNEMTSLECINAYSTTLQSTNGNVYLVVEEGSMPADEAYGGYPYISIEPSCSADTGTKWIYSQFQAEAGSCFEQEGYRFLPRLQADPSLWAPFSGRPVRQCFSEPADRKCKIKYSVHLAIVVILFVAIKTLAISVSIFTLRNDPMLTIGDAVASFLRKPDASTFKMCLVSQQRIHNVGLGWKARKQPRKFTVRKYTWSSAVKLGKRWMIRFTLATGVVVLAGLFLWSYLAISGTKDIISVLRIGLGSIDPRTIVRSDTAQSGTLGILENVLVANSPQVIISLIYFSYNATITSMLLAYEWSGYFTKHKSLRVSSSRQGQQRSTYFLQLPYRYAIPLLGFSTLLHWLASQSIFVISVELYNMYGDHSSDGRCDHWKKSYVTPNGERYWAYCGDDFITFGYSPLGILLSLSTALALTVSIFVLGKRQLSFIPVVGSCSAAIAASCHARPYEQAPWEKKLKWGVFMHPRDRQYYEMDHCGLSSNEVDPPVPGSFYL